MKLISTFCLSLLSLSLLTACGGKSNQGETTPTPYNGVIKLQSKKIPLPLGRYVQLSSNEVNIGFTEPDADGNGESYAYFQFEILRHVPNLKKLNFSIEPVGEMNPYFCIKLNEENQQAVEDLTNAIKDTNKSKVAIQSTQDYSDMVPGEINDLLEQISQIPFEIDHSDIWIDIPPSRITITGTNASSTRVAGGATLVFQSKNGSLYLEVTANLACVGDGYSTLGIAKLRTDNGDFEAYLKRSNFYLNEHTTFPDIWDERGKYWIQPTDMDKLLSSPLSLEIEVVK